MRTCIKILLLLLIPALGMAQQSHLDSLKKHLRAAHTDSARYVTLFALAYDYNETNRDSSLYYINLSLSIAKNNRQLLDEARALDGKGYILNAFGKFPESLECYQQGLKLAEDPASENKIWYHDNNKNFSPHELRIFILASLHHDMGHLMGATNNTDQLIIEYRETKKLAAEIGADNLLGLVNMNLGHTYLKLNRLDSALIMEQNAERIFKQSGFKKYLGSVYNNIGNIYLKKGNNVLGVQYLRAAINTSIEQKNLADVAYGYIDITNHYLKVKQQDSSLFYARKILESLNTMGNKRYMDEAYTYLYQSYKLAGKTDSAYKYQGLALTVKDSIYKAQVKSLTDFQKLSFNTQLKVQALEKEKEASQTRTRTVLLLISICVFMLLAGIFYRNNLKEKKAKNLLQDKNKVIEQTLDHLKNTQTQLIQSEKMASLGELTAGVAHEIQNPLNFVNNFSEVSMELVDEMELELREGDKEEAISIAADIKQNLEKIIHHGKRADGIVKGMLQHSRSTSNTKEATDINKLADEYLRLAFHGLRAKDKSFNAELITTFAPSLPQINVVPQDIGRVLLNLFTNAFYSVHQKQKTAQPAYAPTVELSTGIVGNMVTIKVKDNGLGIPDNIKDKIMQPFFTTKPTGEGTGLGLSLSYDIVVKGHGGKIDIDSKEGEYTEFMITIPI